MTSTQSAAFHIQEAERLLANAYVGNATHYDNTNPGAERAIAEAQAHATLALALGSLGFPGGMPS